MVQCETCKAWQHGQCMHYEAMEIVPQHYYCERCDPAKWGAVIQYVFMSSAIPPSCPKHVLQGMGVQTHPELLITFPPAPHPHRGQRAAQLSFPFPCSIEDYEA